MNIIKIDLSQLYKLSIFFVFEFIIIYYTYTLYKYIIKYIFIMTNMSFSK